MRNHMRHSFRKNYRSGKARISLLKNQRQDVKSLSESLKTNSSGCCNPDKCYQNVVEQQREEKKKSVWLDHLFWKQNLLKYSQILKGDLLGRASMPYNDVSNVFKFGNNLKNYFSTIQDRNYINFKYIGLKNNFSNSEPFNQFTLAAKVHPFIPNVDKTSLTKGPNIKILRSHSSPYLNQNFLRPRHEIKVNGSRTFTTLGNKSKSNKSVVFNPSKVPGNVQCSGNNIGILAANDQMVYGVTRPQTAIGNERSKRKELDWINSFSSEAVIIQPSRGEFSIKNLINKSCCQERLWGLQPNHSFSRTSGPGINDNLIHYMAMKHKLQTEFKKNHSFSKGQAAKQNLKKISKTAKEKKQQKGIQKAKDISNKYSAKKVFMAIKDKIGFKPVGALKTNEKTVKKNVTKQVPKVHKKKNLLERLTRKVKEEPKDKPLVTEYQSSASYKHVFQELFSRANRAKITPKPALSVFNRQNNTRNYSGPASKMCSYGSVRKEKLTKKSKPSRITVETKPSGNLKNQARTPFQKPSNSQITSQSKASFSTVSKTAKMTGLLSIDRPYLQNGNLSSPEVNASSERPVTANHKENESNTNVVTKSLYSTLGYIPQVPKNIVMKPVKKNKKIDTDRKKAETNKEDSIPLQPGNPNNRFFNQRRSLSSFGLEIENITEPEETVIETENEGVFDEVMSLCKGQPPDVKKENGREKNGIRGVKRYGRCSVKEKKKIQKKKGFVCRIASMLNLGCGRRRRPNQGCPECGKKAG